MDATAKVCALFLLGILELTNSELARKYLFILKAKSNFTLLCAEISILVLILSK